MAMFFFERLPSRPLFLLLVAGAPFCVESLLPRTGSFAGFLGSGIKTAQPSGGVDTCTPLHNHGSFSTINLGVGELAQHLGAIVADTGSSSVIVASCQCENCNVNECYDQARSSSAVESTVLGDDLVVLTFGSGDITASAVTDVVKVGAASALMTDGVLTMVSQKLDFNVQFEGILGLGPPTEQNAQDVFHEKNYLVEAGIGHFSFCLNDAPGALAGGVLRLGGPDGTAAKLGSRGEAHWALGLNGISVGDGASSKLQFCSPFDMKSGQVTPCGAIPDSGTTMISGPKNQVLELFDGICDAWPRCVAAQQSSRRSKSSIFQLLLMKCKEWIHEAGLDELPMLHFHVTGADNTEFPLALSPQSYIMEMQQDLYESHFQKLVDVPIPSSLSGEVCAPAFGDVKMETDANGPVWIFGTSFFYEYVVHYNLHPQAISFEQAACGECLPDGTVQPGQDFLLTEGDANGTLGRRALRRLSTAPRKPDRYNTQHGLL